MQNQKVYLAKSHLASGLDFEYVKSNLLRIPDIEIIQYGQGFKPEDCVCVIYVHGDVVEVQEDESVIISRSVFNELSNFINGVDTDEECIFIYLGKSDAHPADIEKTVPFMVPADCLTQVSDDWQDHAAISIAVDRGFCLLESVSNVLDSSNPLDWRKMTRHEQLEEKFSIPPVPTLAQRMSKGTKRSSTIKVENIYRSSTVATSKPKLKSKNTALIIPPPLVEECEEVVVVEEDCNLDLVRSNTSLVDNILANRIPRRNRLR